MKARVSVLCKRDSSGSYFAMCPDIPHCFTQGDTYEDSLKYLTELAESIIAEDLDDDMKEDLLEDLLEDKPYIFGEIFINV